MINFIISLVLGMIPEVLYFTLFLSFTKKVKNKKVVLFLLLALGYVLLIMICRYELLFYLTYVVYSYIIMKMLFKSHIIDIFVYSISFCYLMILSLIIVKLFNNYAIAFIINRILLFIPIILFKNKFNVLYLKYKKLWNRSNDKRKIKSLTLRNFSILFINILIVLINIITFLSMAMYYSL